MCVCVWLLTVFHSLTDSLSNRYDEYNQYGFVGDYSGIITVLKLERGNLKFVTTLRGHTSEISRSFPYSSPFFPLSLSPPPSSFTALFSPLCMNLLQALCDLFVMIRRDGYCSLVVLTRSLSSGTLERSKEPPTSLWATGNHSNSNNHSDNNYCL